MKKKVFGLSFLVLVLMISLVFVGASTCVDYDGGKNYYQKGEVKVFEDGVEINSYWDFCDTGYYQVIEEYCYDESTTNQDNYWCPDRCWDGACINLSDPPCEFVDPDFKACFDLSEHPCEIFDQEFTGIKTYEIGGEEFEIRIFSSNNKYIVFDVNDIYIPNDIEIGDSIKFEKFILTLVGMDYNYTHGAYTNLWLCLNNESFPCPDCQVPSPEADEPTSTCTDTDKLEVGYPESYYIKSTIEHGGYEYTDYCDNFEEGVLREQVCYENGKGSAKSYMCPNGCYDGACINETTSSNITCTDSEINNNYYSLGNITLTSLDCPSTKVSFTDTCLSDWIDDETFGILFINQSIKYGALSEEEKDNRNILMESKCTTPIPSDSLTCTTYSTSSNTYYFIEAYECPNGCRNGTCIGADDDEEISNEQGIEDEEGTEEQETTNQETKYYIQNKEVIIEKNVNGKNIINVEDGSVETSLEIVEKSGKIYIKTSDGMNKEVRILPKEAISNAKKIKVVDKIEIKEEDGKVVYSILGTKKVYLFFVIPINTEVEQNINIQNGEITSTKRPWWHFLALGI